MKKVRRDKEASEALQMICDAGPQAIAKVRKSIINWIMHPE